VHNEHTSDATPRRAPPSHKSAASPLVSWLSLSAEKYTLSPSMLGSTHTWLTHPCTLM